MIDATGNPGKILVLGGSSEIGLAIATEYLSHAPAEVVLAGRGDDPRATSSVELMEAAGASGVRWVDFDATAFTTHAEVLGSAWEGGDVDVAIVAFGLLGDAEELWQDQAKAVEIAGELHRCGERRRPARAAHGAAGLRPDHRDEFGGR